MFGNKFITKQADKQLSGILARLNKDKDLETHCKALYLKTGTKDLECYVVNVFAGADSFMFSMSEATKFDLIKEIFGGGVIDIVKGLMNAAFDVEKKTLEAIIDGIEKSGKDGVFIMPSVDKKPYIAFTADVYRANNLVRFVPCDVFTLGKIMNFAENLTEKDEEE